MSGEARRAGLIVNPRAGKGSGKGPALAETLKGDTRISLHVLERFEHLEDVLAQMAREGVSDLFISSGDGTIQEILTLLAERQVFGRVPRIGLLPHGTTNLSANDLGFTSRSLAEEAAFLRDPVPRRVVTRNTIRCLNPGDGKLRHGMFVGTGAISVGTHYCQRAFNEQGIRGQWAVAKTLLTAVRKYLFSRADAQDEARFDRPYRISVSAAGRVRAEGPQLLHMSTTLDSLLLRCHPFWGGKTGPIRTTAIPYPVPSVLRWMLPIMYGGENHAAPDGAVSFCSDALEVSSDVMFVIDGEFFPAPRDAPLRMETGPLFTFVRA